MVLFGTGFSLTSFSVLKLDFVLVHFLLLEMKQILDKIYLSDYCLIWLNQINNNKCFCLASLLMPIKLFIWRRGSTAVGN